MNNPLSDSSGLDARDEATRPPAGLEVLIQRDIYTGKSTIGRLFIAGEFACYTLEDCRRPDGIKIPGATCIPAGRYPLAINYSRRFRRLMPQLLDVPGFQGIRIHAGNTQADTEGCILVGLSRAGDCIGCSRAAFRKLFARLQAARAAGAEVRVTINDSEPASAQQA